MRKVRNQQLPLAEATADHPKAKELAKISEILDNNNSIYELVLQDLGITDNNVGANGMTAEQVIRAAIIKQSEGYSYRELAFHLADSRTYSRFCRIGFGKSFKKSALQRGIKAITQKTWEQINMALVGYAQEQAIETGRKIRVDCTVVESNIHSPYDSELLVDATRVLARLLSEAKTELSGIAFSFADHRRRVKRRNLEIMNAKNAEGRKKSYKDIIEVTENTIGYAEKGLQSLKSYKAGTIEEWAVVVSLTALKEPPMSGLMEPLKSG